MTVTFFMQNPPKGYSGGRYFALLMAIATARRGHRVTVISSNPSEQFADLANLPGQNQINFIVSKRFEFADYVSQTDIVLLVPSMSDDETLYLQASRCTLQFKARLVLLNFESPNWFNSMSPKPRDEQLWRHWFTYGRLATSILCMAQESRRFAAKWFVYPDHDPRFFVCPPSVNDQVLRAATSSREQRILVFARFSWSEQKGSKDLERLLCPEFAGYSLVLVCGLGQVPEEFVVKLQGKAAEVGMSVEILCGLSECAKAEEYKRAALVIFPSSFEGFGYPPVEALWAGCACVAFDLPVLREFTDRFTYFARSGDWEDFKACMLQALQNGPRGGSFARWRSARYFSLPALGRRLEREFTRVRKLPPNRHLMNEFASPPSPTVASR
tara:strand:+ start:1154 stop:2308 length:1155 start_codon:yes stop_codon:yes gene_type:complete